MWEGWTKNLYPLFGDTAGALASELAAPLAALIGLALLPGFLVSPAVAPSARWIAAAGLLILIAVHAQYALALRRNHFSLRLIKYYLPGILLFGAALRSRGGATSAARWLGRAGPIRRGRHNPHDQVTRKTEFCAAHFYHNPAFSAEENRRVFGKCNNPHGHGHNYMLEVTIAGEPDPQPECCWT